MKYVFTLFLLVFATTSYSQCVDSSRIDTYFPCFDGFNPVCGCNGITYRSPCAADHWGGINTYVNGVCGNFEIDFVPNPVQNYPAEFSAFLTYPGTLVLQIYDVFGKVMYAKNYYTTYPEQKIGPDNVDFSGYPNGLFFVIATVNGEVKSREILHVVE